MYNLLKPTCSSNGGHSLKRPKTIEARPPGMEMLQNDFGSLPICRASFIYFITSLLFYLPVYISFSCRLKCKDLSAATNEIVSHEISPIAVKVWVYSVCVPELLLVEQLL